jgi:hypothetical protein
MMIAATFQKIQVTIKQGQIPNTLSHSRGSTALARGVFDIGALSRVSIGYPLMQGTRQDRP